MPSVLLLQARTIDLCNNPLTKEPKLASARRIIKEWPDLNREAQEFTKEVGGRHTPQAPSCGYCGACCHPQSAHAAWAKYISHVPRVSVMLIHPDMGSAGGQPLPRSGVDIAKCELGKGKLC